MRATFTLDELRVIEDFLDDMVASGAASLDEMRRELSARILGNEIHERSPDLPFAEVLAICEKFLAKEKRT